jgi:catechol 2,3-dioxygenase-like lactoylglutathione lyase family enzyme
MAMRLARVSILVPDYDAGIAFFGGVGFELHEDRELGGGKRWVTMGTPGASTEILLAKAVGDRQQAMIGQQGGGRVWLFLETDRFEEDYQRMRASGISFEEPPRDEPYGRVAVWRDPWGNRWDLVQYASAPK